MICCFIYCLLWHELSLSVTSMWISYLSIIVYNVFVSLHSVILVWKQVSGKIGFLQRESNKCFCLDICSLFYIILGLRVHWALSLRNVFYWGNTITWPLLNPNWAMKWELSHSTNHISVRFSMGWSLAKRKCCFLHSKPYLTTCQNKGYYINKQAHRLYQEFWSFLWSSVFPL